MKRIIVPLMIVCVLILAACSPEPGPPAANLQPVTLQFRGQAQSEYAGYYVALEKGWYRDAGIDLTIQPGGPDHNVIDAVASGNCQFGTASLSDLAVAVEAGQPLISIAQIEQMNGLLLISKKTSGINRPGDLIGKRIGNWGGGWETQINALLTREGIDHAAVTLVNQGADIQPFLDNQLDVISAMVYDEFHQVLESGFKLEEINIIDFTIFGLDFPGEAIFTGRQLARQDPALCQRLLSASLRGWEYAIANNREAVDIVTKYSQGQGLETKHKLSTLREVSRLVNVSWREMGYTDSASVQKMLNTLLAQQTLHLKIKPDAIYTNQYWEAATRKGQ
jgi:NitT/TauT family transport system substrate-binding protein